MARPPRIPRTEQQHFDDAPCHDHPSECSPYPPAPPVLPTPLPPHPPPASSSPPGSAGRSTFVTALIIAGSALAFVILCLTVFLFVRRRRRQRRRREALLEATVVPPDGGGPDDLGGEAEQGEAVVAHHHAWHIRTVGLDEAAIESIALTRYYRAGGGGGASDDCCAVCLGEFADGELLRRLLPGCAHAFHVRCIDTWLRAHVNCPLCRSRVQVPEPAAPAPDPDAAAGGNVATEHDPPDRRRARASELRDLQRLQTDQNDDGRSISPEQQPHRHPDALRGGNFRRVVSMDSSQPPTPEAGGDKQGTARGVAQCEFSPGCSGRLNDHRRGMKRSLSVDSRWSLVSRHCRSTGSLPTL